jgi:hypothetical protein
MLWNSLNIIENTCSLNICSSQIFLMEGTRAWYLFPSIFFFFDLFLWSWSLNSGPHASTTWATPPALLPFF